MSFILKILHTFTEHYYLLSVACVYTCPYSYLFIDTVECVCAVVSVAGSSSDARLADDVTVSSVSGSTPVVFRSGKKKVRKSNANKNYSMKAQLQKPSISASATPSVW